MNKRIFSLAILSASTLFAIENPHVVPCDPGFNTRGFVEFKGPKGVGYEHGYGTFGLFFSPLGQESARAFIDLRGHVFTDGRWAANGGLGVRVAYKEENAIGVNVYYDFRDVRHLGGTNQVGAGFEYLTPSFDLRANGYVPLGGKEDQRNPQFHGFCGHWVVAKETVEAPLPSLDAEIGVPIGGLLGEWDFYCAFGGYYLFQNTVEGKALGDVPGAKVRAFVRPLDSLTIGGDLTYDNIFHVRAQGYATLSFPLGPTNLRTKGKRFKQMFPGSCYQKALNIGLMTQPVYRNEIIPVQSDTRHFRLGCDESCCNAYFVVVDNSFTGFGNGTFGSPFKTLQDAEMFSSPGDIIYVRPGIRKYDGGIALQPGQQLISSSVPYEVCCVCLPACTPQSTPIITNQSRALPSSLPGLFAVVTNGNNVIDGFTIDGSNVSGAFSGIDINKSNNISIWNTDILDVSFGIVGIDGKIGANIDINTVSIQGIVASPLFSADAQFQSGGISLAWDGPLVASSLNICNSQIIGAPAHPVYIVGGLLDSEVNITNSQFFGGHRGIDIGGKSIIGSTISLFGNTISELTPNPKLVGFSEAGFYVNGFIASSSLSFCRNTFSLINEGSKDVFGIRIANAPVRNSTLVFDGNSFTNIGNTGTPGSGIFVKDLEFSTMSVSNGAFSNITKYGVELDTVNGSTVAIDGNSFTGIGVAGIEFISGGILQDSSLAIQGNTFKDSPLTTAFWNQQSPIIGSCIDVSGNSTFGGGFAPHGTYNLPNDITASVLKFCGNTIADTVFGGIIMSGASHQDSAFLIQGNSINQSTFGMRIVPVTVANSTYVIENNQISDMLASGAQVFIDNAFIDSSFAFNNNCISPNNPDSTGIDIELSSSVTDSSFTVHGNSIANTAEGISLGGVSGLSLVGNSFISVTENELEHITRGVLAPNAGILIRLFYNSSIGSALLRINDNCFEDVVNGIHLNLPSDPSSSFPLATVNRNCFDTVSGNSLFLDQHPAHPMTLRVFGNESSNFTGSVDFMLQNVIADIDVIGNSLDGPFSLQGDFCLGLFDNAAAQFDLTGMNLNTPVESPNGHLSGVQRMNRGTIVPTNIEYVELGACSP